MSKIFFELEREIKEKESELDELRNKQVNFEMFGLAIKGALVSKLEKENPQISITFVDETSNKILRAFFENKKELKGESLSVYINSLDLIILESGIDIKRKWREHERFMAIMRG